MGLFKKRNSHIEIAAKSELLFRDIVKDTKELYEDIKAEYETIETVIAEFEEYSSEIKARLDEQQKKKFQEFILRLGKVNNYAHKSLRGVSDLLRSQNKILNEIKRGL